MPVHLIEVKGIKLDVYYDFRFILDKFNISEDSINYELKINAVEPEVDSINYLPILSKETLDEIENKILDIESTIEKLV